MYSRIHTRMPWNAAKQTATEWVSVCVCMRVCVSCGADWVCIGARWIGLPESIKVVEQTDLTKAKNRQDTQSEWVSTSAADSISRKNLRIFFVLCILLRCCLCMVLFLSNADLTFKIINIYVLAQSMLRQSVCQIHSRNFFCKRSH